MNAPLRIGVAGAGLIGRRHAALVAANPDCTLAGIADPSAEARGFAESIGAPWHVDHRGLIDAGLDGLVIATPNTLHVPVALDCVARGLPALIEKPVADSVAAAHRLLDAQRRSGVPLLVGHHRRHNPIVQAARAAIARDELGRLTAVAGLWLLRKPDDYFDVRWRREPGGGPLLLNLIHDIDNFRFIVGEIAAVQAETANSARGFEVEDTAALILRFAGGALGTVTLSDATPAPWSWELASGENRSYPRQEVPCYLFAGTKASLAVPTQDLWAYEREIGWWAPLGRTQLTVELRDPLTEQLRHFLAVIRRAETPLVSAADATRTLAVVEAIHEAARTGHRVTPGRVMEDAA